MVGVVVGVAAEDMEVGPAQPDGRDAYAHVVWPGRGDRNVTNLDPAHVEEYSGAHKEEAPGSRLQAAGPCGLQAGHSGPAVSPLPESNQA